MNDKNWKDDPLENTPPVRRDGTFLPDRSSPHQADPVGPDDVKERSSPAPGDRRSGF